MNELRFTVWEVLSLLGVAQCVYVLVYIVFRVVKIKHIIIPFLYFFTLGTAFFLDFGTSYIKELSANYDAYLWAAWSFCLPLSVLLVVQIAQLSKLPALPYWGVLFLVPVSAAVSALMAHYQGDAGCSFGHSCPMFLEWLRITGLITGAFSLLMIWGQRQSLDDLHSQKAGQERYWLIMSLILVNIGFLSLGAAGTTIFTPVQISLGRTVLGLMFIYITTTSLFRIYPQAIILQQPKKRDEILTKDEENLAQKINALITLDKVYHEPTYSRADLARELNVSEAYVSRVINVAYKKSLPQLLNEQRVADAKRLLLDTDANIKVVAEEVGFNSIPSFNRVFKELEGCSPSDYRKSAIK